MGFLYLFTWGLLLVGTITDLVRYKQLASDYNQPVAWQIASNIPLRPQKPPSSIEETTLIANRGFGVS